jgi:parallel beta-helix repeat protein
MPETPAFTFHSLKRRLRALLFTAVILAAAFALKHSAAAQSTPAVDAGPAKTLAFPARDLTLFGHATDPGNNPLTVAWTMVSGPAPAGFSAPWALATTVTFTTPGTYTFQLAASNGTATGTSRVTVTVNPESSQTAFYVDPTYTGSTQTGAAATPWKSFLDQDSDDIVKWNTINAALASNDVIIYFSARQARSDTSEQLAPTHGSRVFVNRRCAGGSSTCPGPGDTTRPHRLTIDGMSLYNTDDARPNWVPYGGANRFKINCVGSNSCGSQACCWDDDKKRDYITIRGFEVTGNAARFNWGGSYTTMEHIWSHDVTEIGAQVQFQNSSSDCTAFSGPLTCTAGCRTFGVSHDITVRNNTIERGQGEGLYMGATYQYTQYGGCPALGNTHYDILIEGNTIKDAGSNGDEGDGIDLKMGLHEMTVRDNVINNPHNACEGGGMTTLGVFQPAQSPAVTQTTRTNYLFEGNRIYNGAAEDCTENNGGISIYGNYGTIIRNNVIYNTGPGGAGLLLEGDDTFNNYYIAAYNNTLYNNAAGIALYDNQHVTLKNNVVVGNGDDSQISNGFGTETDINGDYNLLAPSGSDFSEGSHSIVLTSTARIFVSTTTPDLHLSATSPAIARGLNLTVLAPLVRGYSSWVTTFTKDFAGSVRPVAPASWDLGAYTLTTGSPPSAPKDLKVVR